MDVEQTTAQVLSFLRELVNGNDASSSPTTAEQQQTNSVAAIMSPMFYKLYTPAPEEVSNEISDCIRNCLEERNYPHLMSLFLSRSLMVQVQDFVQGQGESEIQVDASPKGLGAVLLQKDVDMSLIYKTLPPIIQQMIEKLLSEPSFESELRKRVESEDLLPHYVSTFAIRNKRRKMEDRHVVIRDLNTLLGLTNFSAVNSYYAVFDGHAGVDAASYAAAHLHVNLARDPNFFDDPRRAMQNAYRVTDANLCKKALTDGVKSGCTAVTALIRDKTLVLAWLGDSQAVLIDKGKAITIMNPHKPNRQDEKERIESLGGFVHHIGTWRVNGALAVSRALGDYDLKPYVSSEPELNVISLKGTEDFLVLACDGLWDAMSPNDVATMLYKNLNENACDSAYDDAMAEKLVHQSKQQGSDDNITVLVIYLRSVPEISADKDQRDLQQETANESTTPITGEVHCPERPKILENIISFPSLCPKSQDEQSDMPMETEPTEFSELPTPPIDDIKNHFSEYYSQGVTEKPMEQEENDCSLHDNEMNNSNQVADTSGDLFDLLTDPSAEFNCEAPVLDTNYSAAETMEEHFESTTVTEKIESTFESIHSQLNPEAVAFVPKFCNVELSSVVQEVQTEEFHSVEIKETSMHSIEKLDESSELLINACVENLNVKNLQHSILSELSKNTTDDQSEIKRDSDDVTEQIIEHVNFPVSEPSAQIELIELPAAQECLIDQSTNPVSNTCELQKEEMVFENEIPKESIDPLILPQTDTPSVILGISQNLDEEKVENLMNAVNDVIQHSDASSTEFTVAVDLQSVPDGIPEAEGVCEDIDSDSEKDGGWSYMKAADNVLEGVGKIVQPSKGENQETSCENTEDASNKIKLEPPKSNKTSTIKQRVLRANQQKKDSAIKSTAPVKRSPVLPKMPIKATGLTNTSSQAQASKTAKTLQSSKVPPTTKTKASLVSTTDSSKNATKSNISVAAKKETTLRSTIKPAVPAVKKEPSTKAAPTKTSLAAPKTTSPALHKTASPTLHKVRSPAAAQKTTTASSPIPKSMPQYLKSKPVTSPSGVKPSNPVPPQKVCLSSTVQKPTVKKLAAVQKPVSSSSRNGISRPNPPVSSAEAKAPAPKRNLQALKPNPEMKETKNAMNKQLVARKTGLSSTAQSKTTTGDAKKSAVATTVKTASVVMKSKKTTITSTVSQPKKASLPQQQQVTKKIIGNKSSIIKEASSIVSDNSSQQVDAVELCNEESKSSTEKFNLECDIKESPPLVEIVKNELSTEAISNFSSPQDPSAVLPSAESVEVLKTEGILATNVENVEN